SVRRRAKLLPFTLRAGVLYDVDSSTSGSPVANATTSFQLTTAAVSSEVGVSNTYGVPARTSVRPAPRATGRVPRGRPRRARRVERAACGRAASLRAGPPTRP